MTATHPELVFHDLREPEDYDRFLRARAVVPLRRIEVDLRLTETGLGAADPRLDVEALFAFARREGAELFIHLVDDSVYTDRAMEVLAERLGAEDVRREETIIGSTHIAGMLAVARRIPEVSNQGRFPVPGIRYVHTFGPDLLRVLTSRPERFGGSATEVFETLFDVTIPAHRSAAYADCRLITSFDALDKRTGAPVAPALYADGLARLAQLRHLDLLITNGLKDEGALAELGRHRFRS